MNLNASIIDQQVRALADKLKDQFAERLNIQNDEVKLRSTAFVLLCVKTVLDLTEDEAMDCMTEGGSDFGVDAVEVSDVQDGEFTVTLFQGKYKQDLEGNANFPENGVTKAIQAVRLLFDPASVVTVNPQLLARLEEIRSLIRDGNIPRVRFVLCNNGLPWPAQAQQLIDRERFPDQVRFEHVNHDVIINLLQSSQPVRDVLHFSGKAIVEDFNFIRVVVGKVPVTEIAELLRRHGDRLLERNIRRYLGLYGNRVNEGIRQTLLAPTQRPNFYFYNNGLTLTCRKFDYNALQGENYQVKVEGLQIINGGQTCKTVEAALRELNGDQLNLDQAFVLVRLYQLPDDGTDLVRSITYATNSQNPVDLRDLRSNDERQRKLELSIEQLGYQYRRQRSDLAIKPTDISSATAAEAVLSVWRRRPHQAKFMSREHFGKFYDLIFTPDLNGAQVVVATLLFRIAENKRKRPPSGAPEFLRYGSCFLAMLMGKYLLHELGIELAALNHRSFTQAKDLTEQNGEDFFQKAVAEVQAALIKLYGGQDVSLQRLSATFRRGDLIEELNTQPSLLDTSGRMTLET
ncbi:MAG: AIPR family protein [Verrucomicrobia bacterium]|nr:AIPR family protein [Verrucomicrobiota bacterium]